MGGVLLGALLAVEALPGGWGRGPGEGFRGPARCCRAHGALPGGGAPAPPLPAGSSPCRKGPHLLARPPLRAPAPRAPPAQVDALSGFKKLFSFGRKAEAAQGDGKPKKIIWASKYAQYKAEQQQQQQKGGKKGGK